MIPNNSEKAKVTFTCLSTNQKVSFFPYDFEFSDNFKPEWNTYDAFGRMDPILVYKRTTRDANLSFNVVGEDAEDAKNNFENLKKLIQGLYGQYSGGVPPGRPPARAERADAAVVGGAAGSGTAPQIINKGPLFQVRFMNLLNENEYVVAINSFKHTFKFEAGGSSVTSDVAVPGEFNLNIGMKIIHTTTPGKYLNYQN